MLDDTYGNYGNDFYPLKKGDFAKLCDYHSHGKIYNGEPIVRVLGFFQWSKSVYWYIVICLLCPKTFDLEVNEGALAFKTMDTQKRESYEEIQKFYQQIYPNHDFVPTNQFNRIKLLSPIEMLAHADEMEIVL